MENKEDESLSEKIKKLKVYVRSDQEDFDAGENMREDILKLLKSLGRICA